MQVLKKITFFIWIFLMLGTNIALIAQTDTSNEDVTTTETSDVEEEPIPEVKLAPLFPEKNTKLIFLEGEDAVSTNFNKEPILNYGCSGKRTLQLSRIKGLQGGAPFYADFVFFVEEPGTYEFWYGGTPSGPADELYPSYVSPFKYVLDNAREKQTAYREDITVVENYTPSYYWNMVTEIELTAGQHQIRFEVDEKRHLDNRFYFYLDSFFFVKIEEYQRVTGSILPQVFPKNLEGRSINYPFRAVDDYLISIRDNPENVEAYEEISLIYSLVGDYLNALKYLKRATILDAKNLDYQLLLAKNYIWKGEISQGLELYGQILRTDPTRQDLWMEAGKVAAWTSRYVESDDFFSRGLEYFPGNLDLTVNLGLTYLWSGMRAEADSIFLSATAAAGSNAAYIKELANVFIVNGYPDRAIDVYRAGIRQVPDDIELYLLLEQTYFNNGQKDKATSTRDRIVKTFIPSGELNQYLNIFYERMGLKEAVIQNYEQKLKENPDDLELREMLAQAYFWNGLKNEAIDEYLNILSNHAYRQLNEMEQESFALLQVIDRNYVYKDYFSKITQVLNAKRQEIVLQINRYNTAIKNNTLHQDRVKKAADTGKTVATPAVDPQIAMVEAGELLASLLADADQLQNQYDNMYNAYLADLEIINNLSDRNDQEEEVFAKIIELIGWKWNKNLFIREQQQIAGKGMTLANHVLGRVFQISRSFNEAQANYQIILEQLSYPSVEYGYYQTLLWNGNLMGALEYAQRPESTIGQYATYISEIQELAGTFTPEITGSLGVLGEDPTLESKAALDLLMEKSKDAVARQTDINGALSTLHQILENTMVRNFYRYQENTYLLRNELGDSLLIAQRLTEAIDQYTQVLAIDPWDISAIYRLGTVYQWNENWYKAMQFFARVYAADPNYENATALYNSLARANADTLDFFASYSADSTSLTWEGEAAFATKFNGYVGLDVSYRSEYKNVYRYPPSLGIYNPLFTGIDVNNYAYQIHDLALGLPLTIRALYFKLHPVVGSTLVLGDNFLNELGERFGITFMDGTNTIPVSPAAFFGFNELYPYAKAFFEIGKSPWLLLSGEARYGTYEPTYGYTRKKSKAFSGNANLATDLVYTGIPFIKLFSLRVYGEWDLIDDLDAGTNNTIYAATGALNLKLLEKTDPFSSVSLFGNFTYQDSTIDVAEDLGYFSPHQILVAGGGAIGTTTLGLTNSSAIVLNVSVDGAYNQEYNKWGSGDHITRRGKIQVAGNIYFIKGEAELSVGSLFNTQKNLGTGQWDSWNFSASLGFSGTLPSLLAK